MSCTNHCIPRIPIYTNNTIFHHCLPFFQELMDELHGKRVHAWVLVLAGKRMLEKSLFVEPSTGA